MRRLVSVLALAVSPIIDVFQILTNWRFDVYAIANKAIQSLVKLNNVQQYPWALFKWRML